MLEYKDFKSIVDYTFIPLIIGKTESDETGFTDFEVVYMNKAFKQTFPGLFTEGQKYSQCVDSLSVEMNWKENAEQAIKAGTPVSYIYYSATLSKYFCATIGVTEGKFLAISIQDITETKEHEQQLRRQNLRLAALTDELSLSKENLRSKLENIEALNEELEYIAYHDTLTGIYNRQKMNDDLKRCQKLHSLEGMKYGIILIDLDNMKLINDSQGHNYGDGVICNASVILKRFLRDNLKIYRFGGDEFIILVEQLSSRDTILNIADAVLEAFNAEGIEFSAGIAIYPDDTTNNEELLKFADMALYEVKKKGRNNISFFQNIMQEKFLTRLTLQNKISDALENNDFQLYYQPQFDVATGKLRGFEALLRWYDEKLGWISPEQFVSIAEETRLVIPLGDWVMETALSTLKEWTEKYKFNAIMSVNVSPVQLKKPDFLFWLSDKIKQYGINTANLEIEITEGVLIDNKEEIIKLLKQVRKLGVGISLDDFGTGYSSLKYLQMLPITTLKIDKSFIANITSDTGVEANITDSIVSMVSKMGLDTIAEGVEKPEQLKVLKEINCKTIQGFLKGKPMEKERCSKMLDGDMSAVLTINN